MLTALAGAFTLTARVESLQGRVLDDGARLHELTRAGLEYALARISDPDPGRAWRPDGRPYRLRFADADIEVRIVDESGKVDLNQADAGLLAALMRTQGVDDARARRLAAAIVDWRDPDPLQQPGGAEDADYAAAGLPYGAKDQPFESLAEVEQVLGMDRQTFARLQPYLTLHSGRAQPDPAFASEPVLTALGLQPETWMAQRRSGAGNGTLVGQGTGTYSVESRARQGQGRVATLRAVVRAGGGPIPGSAYVALGWDENVVSR
ncbi:general secretion pathway protein GspK [Stenotrophomonas daejeonensis]|uniref:General secretion pathway protein GspK n=1 Tax=Stenotrophomonas daejeonensis TaxID=659018 RepID=A0A0R0DNS4_9GAMM|nr:type II secretion system protein GspK [Stenotrophomonas daejeonensis]KRG82998.1 general secretion pathway protein GspK [Stenotrophomonas daejeonensis]